MLSRSIVDDRMTLNDTLLSVPPPACLERARWRNPSAPEIAKLRELDSHDQRVGRVACVKQQERNRCQLQVARFYEDLVRPGMLLGVQHPRRNQCAPGELDECSRDLAGALGILLVGIVA